MTITGQTYLERSLDHLPLDNPASAASLMRIDEDLIPLDALATWIGGYIQTVVDNIITNANAGGGPAISCVSVFDNAQALVVQSSDNSPAVPPFSVVRADQEVLAEIHSTWLGVAIGLINAINVFDAKLWIRNDQLLPVGASNGQWLLRPRVP